MLKRLASAAFISILVALHQPAWGHLQQSPLPSDEEDVANSTGKCGGRQGGDSALCGGTMGTTALDKGSTTTSGSGSVTIRPTSGSTTSSSTVRYVPYDRLVTGPDGQPCVTTGYTQVGSSPDDVAP